MFSCKGLSSRIPLKRLSTETSIVYVQFDQKICILMGNIHNHQ